MEDFLMAALFDVHLDLLTQNQNMLCSLKFSNKKYSSDVKSIQFGLSMKPFYGDILI